MMTKRMKYFLRLFACLFFLVWATANSISETSENGPKRYSEDDAQIKELCQSVESPSSRSKELQSNIVGRWKYLPKYSSNRSNIVWQFLTFGKDGSVEYSYKLKGKEAIESKSESYQIVHRGGPRPNIVLRRKDVNDGSVILLLGASVGTINLRLYGMDKVLMFRDFEDNRFVFDRDKTTAYVRGIDVEAALRGFVPEIKISRERFGRVLDRGTSVYRFGTHSTLTSETLRVHEGRLRVAVCQDEDEASQHLQSAIRISAGGRRGTYDVGEEVIMYSDYFVAFRRRNVAIWISFNDQVELVRDLAKFLDTILTESGMGVEYAARMPVYRIEGNIPDVGAPGQLIKTTLMLSADGLVVGADSLLWDALSGEIDATENGKARFSWRLPAEKGPVTTILYCLTDRNVIVKRRFTIDVNGK